MTLLHNTAIQKLKVAHPRLNPVNQIAIARKYHCDELIDEPFQTLVARKEVLSREEIAQLPLEDLYLLIEARETSIRSNAETTPRSCPHPNIVPTCEDCLRCTSCGGVRPVGPVRPVGLVRPVRSRW